MSDPIVRTILRCDRGVSTLTVERESGDVSTTPFSGRIPDVAAMIAESRRSSPASPPPA